jgi:hypothetical protein
MRQHLVQRVELVQGAAVEPRLQNGLRDVLPVETHLKPLQLFDQSLVRTRVPDVLIDVGPLVLVFPENLHLELLPGSRLDRVRDFLVQQRSNLFKRLN